ncbi:MAG: neutral/alkaline non-lysosomal ceramidase N-terminal domain-containing protein [Planctomycetota bacterium]
MSSASMRRRITLALLAIIGPILLWGCATIEGELRPAEPRPKPDQLLAGAAKADLTPPPGYPMGGYSVAGKIGRGFWTRLWARAIYLEDSEGRSALLVSCDLWAIPGGLRDRVVEELQNRPETAHLASEEVMIAATHTHHSPGNFSTHDIYNENASPRVGFSEELFDFLVARIADAGWRAVQAARPARAKWAEASLTGVGRNRSIEAFRLNGDRSEILGRAYGSDPNAEVPEELRAVDRRLTGLVLEDIDDEALIGIAAVLAVHNTALDVSTEVYHGDLFGLTSDRLETDLAEEGSSRAPVVAIFNGAEGDVSPDTRARDRGDVLRLVERIATGIEELRETAVVVENVEIDARLDIVDLRDQELEDAEGRRWRTDDRPLPGVAQLGGAEDGRSFLYELGFQEGIRSDRRSETQGAKHGALDVRFDPDQLGLLRHGLRFVQWLVYPGKSDVPNEVPVAWIRIGPMVWVGLPGEPTTMVGHRVERAVEKALGDLPVCSIRTIGLANEYVSYLTTPEEYDAQHYEGASTLYGPATAPLLFEKARKLTESSKPDIRDFCYSPGTTRSFSPMEAGISLNDPFAGLDAILETVTSAVHPSRLPRFTWRDAVPDLEQLPSVTLLGLDAPGGNWKTIADDAGPELLLVLLGCDDEESLWTAIWVTAPIGAMPWLALEVEVQTASGEVRRLRPEEVGR